EHVRGKSCTGQLCDPLVQDCFRRCEVRVNPPGRLNMGVQPSSDKIWVSGEEGSAGDNVRGDKPPSRPPLTLVKEQAAVCLLEQPCATGLGYPCAADFFLEQESQVV